MAVICGGTEKVPVMPETVKNYVVVFKYNLGVSEMPFTLFLEYVLSTERIYLKYSMYKLLRERIMNHLFDESCLLENKGLHKESLIGMDIYSQYCEFKLRSYKFENEKFIKSTIF